MKKLILVVAGFMLLAQLFVIPGVATAGSGDPTILTLPVSDITCNSAVFKADLVDVGNYTPYLVSFEYGTVPGTYPNSAPVGEISDPGVQQATVAGLAPGTLYYVRPKFMAPCPSRLPSIFYSSAAGVGIGFDRSGSMLNIIFDCPFYGSVVSFQTPDC